MRVPLVATFTGVILAAGIILLSSEKHTGDPDGDASLPASPRATASASGFSATVLQSSNTLPAATSSRHTEWRRLKNPSSRAAVRKATQNRSALRRSFALLARLDRSLAIELALRLPGGRNQDIALDSIARQFSRTLARQGAPAGVNSSARGQRLIDFLTKGNLPPLLVLRIAARQPADSPAAFIASRALAAAAPANPTLALAMSKLHPDSRTASAAVATGWAQTAPRAALDWARTLDSPELRAAALSSVALALANRDAPFAATVAAEVPTAKRTETLRGIANVWAGVDTEAALRWATSLPDPVESQTALSTIRQVAPTGVGILLRPSQNSPYPSAADIVPGGPAAKSGAIRAGDAIVAVGDGSGTWSSTSGRNLQAITESIRGEPGRVVQLQVLPAGTTDSTQLRTVTLTREQILFKRPQPGLPDA